MKNLQTQPLFTLVLTALVALLLLLNSTHASTQKAQFHSGHLKNAVPKYLEPLPRPISLRPYIDFWVQIYGVLDDGKGLIHDSQRTDKVYQVIEVPHGKGIVTKRKVTKPIIQKYRRALIALADGKPADNPYRKRARTLWGDSASADELLEAAERLRFQPGHADEFKNSLQRGALVQPYIRRALRHYNLPLELDSLPHVESFFRNDETSAAGAIGIWQFTPNIGRNYMRVDELIDERRDPRKSALAAAALMAHNLEITGNWPMAVTAYNHGTTGVLRAARELGTPDLGTIARHYTGEHFGFASRNFYAAVLAAAEVEANAYRYFGPLSLPPPIQLSAHHTPANITLSELAKELGTPLKTLQQHNPALGESLRSNKQSLPTGYTLWLECSDCSAVTEKLAQLRAESPDGYRRIEIKAGDSLSIIAERNQLKTATLVKLNGLKSANQIRVGQKLKLPQLALAVEPKGKQIAIPKELMTPLDQPMFSADELRIQHRLRHPDPYRPDQRYNYRTQLAQLHTAQDSGLAAKSATGTRYPDETLYSVAKDSSVRLQPAETIDHLAQWLEVDPNSLFLINHLKSDDLQAIDQKITVIFDSINQAEFERRRKRYHREKQRRLYADRKITGTIKHKIKSGEQIWKLSSGNDGVPLWLLLEYNPDADFTKLRPGDELRLPRLEARING